MEQYFQHSSVVLDTLDINSIDSNIKKNTTSGKDKPAGATQSNNENDTVFNPAFDISTKPGMIRNGNGGKFRKGKQNENNKPKKENGRHESKRSEKKNLIPMFIGGLGPHVTEDNLRQVFGEYSSLHSVRICVDASTRSSLGYGYLNFTKKLDVENCVEKYNYTVVFGNEIKIMPSVRNSVYRKNIGTNVFFSNMPLENTSLTTRVFYDTFKVYGKILSCKLDKRKNIGFVYFEDDKAATTAIGAYNNKEYFGATIACGLHFDKELRNYPDFDKTKLNLDKNIILEDELQLSGSVPDQDDSESQERLFVHPNALFVKNLPKHTTEDELMEYFCSMGPVKSVFTSDGNSQQHFKWAFITYKRQEDAKKAIALLNGSTFQGCEIGVSKAKPRKTQVLRMVDEYCLVISDLSSVCTKSFISRLLSQEGLHYDKFLITSYNNGQATFSGLLSLRSKTMQNKVARFLNDKLIGGSVAHVRLPNSESELYLIKERLSETTDESEGFVEKTQLMLPKIETLMDKANMYEGKDAAEYRQKTLHERYQKGSDVFLVEQLKKQIRKTINFLKLDLKKFDEDSLKSISDYVQEVFWYGDRLKLNMFIFNIGSNVKFEQFFNGQVTEALESLGYITNETNRIPR